MYELASRARPASVDGFFPRRLSVDGAYVISAIEGRALGEQVNSSSFAAVFRDLARTVELSEIWSYLALDDVIARYKRTVLGPLWNAAYMAATATAMAVVFGGIFGQPLTKVLPYILGGFLSWSFGPGIVIESANLLSSSSGAIKSSNLPYFFYVMRSITRNLLMCAHNLAVFFVILLCLHLSIWIHWLFLPSIALVTLAAIPYSMLIGLLCVRFRDVQMFVNAFSQVLYFVTPIMWTPDKLPPNKMLIVTLNPFYYFVDLVRSTLTNQLPMTKSWLVVLFVGLIGWAACIVVLAVTRRRVAFWV